ACLFDLSLVESTAFWGYKDDVLRLAYWHPMLATHDEEGWHDYPLELVHQPFFFEAASWDVSLDMPSGWVVAAPGEHISTQRIGNREIHRWSMGPGRDFTVAASPRYQVLTEKSGDVDVSVYALPEDLESAQEALSCACEALAYYAERFGPYPFSRFNVAEVHLAWLGNEFSGEIFIDRRGFRLPKLLERHLDFLICHETAHQWWYLQVGNDQYRAAFLDEAMATLSEGDYLEAKYGTGDNYYVLPEHLSFLPTTSFLEARRTRYLDYARSGRDEPVLASLSEWETPEAAFVMSYDKGMLFLRSLRGRIGAEAFESALRSYLAKFRWQTATVDDLRGAMEQASGEDLEEFFRDWLQTDHELDYALVRPESHRFGDSWKTTLTVERRGGIASELDLLCRFKDGDERTISLTGEPESEQVTLTSAAPLLSAELDPGEKLLDVRRIDNAWPRPTRFRVSPYYAAIYDVPALNRSEKREIFLGVPINYFNTGLRASIRELYDWSAFAEARWDFHHSGIMYKGGGALEHVTGPNDTVSLEAWRFAPLDDGGERTKGALLSWRRKSGPTISGVEPLENGYGFFLRREDLW
ncbi:MAG TPA: M1 family peptidase, partial [Alphaproteobacteria bacterium]|nr:M1 family peptidase [Alphaproteobacteria bacterium]